MLQILVWGVCAIILGVGFCGLYLAEIAAGEKKKSFTGVGILILMIFLALSLFVLSILQGQKVGSSLGL
jgi:hypothetical protein